jgi:dipeptidase D
VCHLPIQRESVSGLALTLTVGGLKGGHSGVEIDKGRANANQLLGRALNELRKVVPFHLCAVDGGLKDNAIPRESTAGLVIDPQQLEAVQAFVGQYQAIFAAEYQTADPSLTLTLSVGEAGDASAMDADSATHTIAALLNLPGGIQRMSLDIPGLVQTSLNLGILNTYDTEVKLVLAIRSSVGTEKDEVFSRVVSLITLLGGTVDRLGDYPAWEYNHNSKLRDLMTQVFEDQYGHKPVVQALHAGVECGLFAGKLPGLDCVSFGPDMMDIHTPQERLSVASVERTWNYLLEILKRLA